jgi:DNA invertase Pin-like site-specific DNA recombinase
LRQREAVSGFARRAGCYELVAEFSDDAVKGSNPVDVRPGFAAMLARVASNGVRAVVVETASRFARDLIGQETGYRFLRDAGITLVAADSPDSFLDDTPTTAVLIRQVLGAVSQFEKAALVAKLRGARERKKRESGKCGGRMNYLKRNPDAVRWQRSSRAIPSMANRRSLRDVAAELEAHGHLSAARTRYSAKAVARMIAS